MDEARRILLQFDEGLLTVEEAKKAIDDLVSKQGLWPGTAAAFKIELERSFKGGFRS